MPDSFIYAGIPYAEPPIGNQRFRKPVAKQPFEEPYDATKLGNICYQIAIVPNGGATMSEDCLFLNIFAPVQRKAELPVLMFIHGGGFISGSSDPLIADTLAAHGGMIVVTINYRLSLWGFLSTEDEQAPGNYGLWDQSLAIKWLNNNIRAFGGDPGRVTIAGESAGSVSVVYQSLYEGNGGLFQRAIALSGSITAPLFVGADNKKDAQKLGKLVGCEDEKSATLIDCLRKVPGEKFSQLINDFSHGFMAFPMAFVPNIDGDFLKENPHDVLNGDSEKTSKGRDFFSTVDFLSGIDAEEGIQMLPVVLGGANPEKFKPSREVYEKELIPAAVSFALGNDAPDVIKDLLVHEYTDWSEPENDEKRRHKLVDIYSDLFFSVTLVDTIARHVALSRRKKGTYMFVLDVVPSVHLLPSPSWSVKATHGDELQYLFYGEDQEVWKFLGQDSYRPEPWETNFAKEMMNMWSNFVTTGYVALHYVVTIILISLFFCFFLCFFVLFFCCCFFFFFCFVFCRSLTEVWEFGLRSTEKKA